MAKERIDSKRRLTSVCAATVKMIWEGAKEGGEVGGGRAGGGGEGWKTR